MDVMLSERGHSELQTDRRLLATEFLSLLEPFSTLFLFDRLQLYCLVVYLVALLTQIGSMRVHPESNLWSSSLTHRYITLVSAASPSLCATPSIPATQPPCSLSSTSVYTLQYQHDLSAMATNTTTMRNKHVSLLPPRFYNRVREMPRKILWSCAR